MVTTSFSYLYVPRCFVSVDVSISQTGGRWYWEVSHSKDYGCFGYTTGDTKKTQKEFFRKQIGVSSIVSYNSYISYSLSATESLLSYTAPYYYNNYQVYNEGIEWAFYPIGRFNITYNNSAEDEVLLFVRVCDAPCVQTDTYGYKF